MNKIILGSLIAGSMLLAGCSTTHQKIDQLSTDVGMLSQKVDALQGDVNQLHQDVQAVSSEAARANQRLDNQQTMVKYKK
ncbi:LPP leucine zipper domain-containing protein [Shigella flexneri]